LFFGKIKYRLKNNYLIFMSKITKFVLLLIPVILLVQIGIASADLYVPSPEKACRAGEEYFKEGTIDENDYKKIRSVVFDDELAFFESNRIGEEGFCVNRDEYCSENNCDLLMSLRAMGSVRFHMKNVLVNFVLNAIFIFLICFIAKVGLKPFRKIGSLIKIAIITVLGYIADFLAMFLAVMIAKILTEIGVIQRWRWYKLDFTEIITQPLVVALTVIIAFILVSLIFYIAYSKLVSTSRKKRIVFALIFGVLSNPIWYVLYKVIFGL